MRNKNPVCLLEGREHNLIFGLAVENWKGERRFKIPGTSTLGAATGRNMGISQHRLKCSVSFVQLNNFAQGVKNAAGYNENCLSCSKRSAESRCFFHIK